MRKSLRLVWDPSLLTLNLDRFQEARLALGHEPFDPFILENMISVLSPYRREAHRASKLSLYLSATSLLSKSPLPYDTIDVARHLQDFIEDAVIISARLAATEEGARAIKEGERRADALFLSLTPNSFVHEVLVLHFMHWRYAETPQRN